MFYDSTAIQTLIDRIGWAAIIPPTAPASVPFVVDSANMKADSGRYFVDFHKLAIVENVIEVQPQYAANATTLNAYLYQMKRAAVLTILARIFDTNERAHFQNGVNANRVDISGTDYSTRINGFPGLFDNAIGYQMAYDVLDLIGTAIRSNQTQRFGQNSYGMIKAEQDGYTDENGKPVDRGIQGRLTATLREINNILFPEVTGQTRNIYGRSNVW